MNTMRKLVLVLGLVGCGAAESTEDPQASQVVTEAACVALSGTYEASYAEVSINIPVGDERRTCGRPKSNEESAADIMNLPAGCRALKREQSSCADFQHVSCDSDTWLVSRRISWSADAHSATGKVYIQDELTGCRSEYDVSYRLLR